MAESQLYSIIDRGLTQLSEHLAVLNQLMQTDEETKEAFAHLIELNRRFEIEERLLRIRFGLEKPTAQDKPASYLLLKSKPESRPELSTMTHLRLRAAQEVARSLEEYFRFFRIQRVGGFFKRLRFDLYEIERQATATLGPPEVEELADDEFAEHDTPHNRVAQALATNPLYFIVDESLCEYRDPARVAYDAIQGGVRMVQLRLKSQNSHQVLDVARKIRRVCAQNNCLFIINDRLDIALLSGADGVHVGKSDLPAEDIRHIGADLIIGVTCRKPQDALAAQTAGADYIGTGSVYGSNTKPGLPVIGVRGLARVARAVDIPVVGIGGITLDNAKDVLTAGAAGVCSIKPFAAQRSIVNLAAKFRDLKK